LRRTAFRDPGCAGAVGLLSGTRRNKPEQSGKKGRKNSRLSTIYRALKERPSGAWFERRPALLGGTGRMV
ncbi:MAG TPA: hypothetical protein PKA36_05495, partial [Pseudoxanthomonas mexicana]|nr:hypothetical protein [Pseudoxanthomonas mexicana]